MSLTVEPPVAVDVEPLVGVAPDLDLAGEAETSAPAGEPGRIRAQAPLLTTCAAAFLAMSAATTMLAGVFKGIEPRAAGVAAVALGTGLVYLASRTGRSWIQYLILPLAIVFGAVLMVPEATGRGGADLVSLVVEAVRQGGILQPPIAFDPGWRLILVVIVAVLGAGTASLALALRRPLLAVLVPGPLAMAGELIQPASSEIVSTLVAVVTMVAALGVAFGAHLEATGVAVSSGFGRARLLRTGAMVLALAVAGVGISRADFLFPQPQRTHVIPPQRPHQQPPPPDSALFDYTSEKGQVPLRVGVLDVYDLEQTAWLLPSYDPSRLTSLDSGQVPDAPSDAGGTFKVNVTIRDAPGHLLPDIAGMTRLSEQTGSGHVTYDPETQVAQLADDRVFNGLAYTMQAVVPPTGQQLATAPTTSGGFAMYLVAPPMPSAVAQILANAPQDPYDRLQALRDALLSHVVAAGAGDPSVAVPPSRVVDMLQGKNATPYEITAAETLLARWAGVPARIGFGYYKGTALGGGTFQIRPRDASAWLEVHFQGYGWVPIVGTPRKAEESASSQQSNPDIVASNEVGLVLWVPTRQVSVRQLFELVRYWLAVVGPWVLLALLLFAIHPGVVKVARRLRRRRWAAGRSPRARALVAYAEFRDMAMDLGAGEPNATPLEFQTTIAEDAEVKELAWLATRALWGDLQRDLDDQDAECAWALSTSVIRRLLRAQKVSGVLLALVSKGSLREPYTREIPNLWPRPRARRRRVRRPRLGGRVPRRVRRLLPGFLATLLLAGCGSADLRGPTRLSTTLVPGAVGEVHFQVLPQEEVKGLQRAGSASLASTGRVYLIRHGSSSVVDGDVQLWLLEPDVRADDDIVRAGLDDGIGGHLFTRLRIVPDQVIWEKDLDNERVFFWTPPLANAVELVALRKDYAPYRELVRSLVDWQHGRAPTPFTVPEPAPAAAAPSAGGVYDYQGAAVQANPQNPPAQAIPAPTPGTGGQP